MPSTSDLRAAVTAAESALSTLRADAKSKADAWRASVSALGTMPPAVPRPMMPKAPDTDRPADVATAREVIANAPILRDRAAQYQRKLAADERAHADAQAAAATAATRAALVTATLAAARQAPSDIAREQADLLATERVRFVFPAERTKQTPHVTAEFHHPAHGWIPFASASSGERVEASVHVQAKIRDLAAARPDSKAFAFVPIVADLGDYNGGAGPYPDVPGFVLWHVSTEAGSDLSVTPGRFA